MKEEILQQLAIVLNALNTIPVSGKQNLANLSGSIAVLEEIIGVLGEAEIASAEKKE